MKNQKEIIEETGMTCPALVQVLKEAGIHVGAGTIRQWKCGEQGMPAQFAEIFLYLSAVRANFITVIENNYAD